MMGSRLLAVASALKEWHLTGRYASSYGEEHVSL